MWHIIIMLCNNYDIHMYVDVFFELGYPMCYTLTPKCFYTKLTTVLYMLSLLPILYIPPTQPDPNLGEFDLLQQIGYVLLHLLRRYVLEVSKQFHMLHRRQVTPEYVVLRTHPQHAS